MRRFRKILYSSLFGSLMLTASSHGAVPDAAFKGLTRHFKKQYFSPTLGRAALDHLIPNIRFHWGVKGGYDETQEQERSYISDQSDDPLWRVTRVLFPSVDGNLGDSVGGDTHHQHFSNYVESTKTIALLMCYVEEVRTHVQSHLAQVSQMRSRDKYNSLEEGKRAKEHQKILDTLKKNYAQKIKETLSYQDFSSAHLNPFLSDVALAVSHEEMSVTPLPAKPMPAPKKRGARSCVSDDTAASSLGTARASSDAQVAVNEIKTLTPVHTTEQVILGFLCFHFDKQEDLWDYMEDVQKLQSPENKIIEDTFTNPHGNSLFDHEKDSDLLMKKQNGSFDLDDLYNLVLLAASSHSVPYTRVLSNGHAWVYDRVNDSFAVTEDALLEIQQLISLRAREDGISDFLHMPPVPQDGRLEIAQSSFADCVEILIRHVFNFILYDKKTHKFDVEHLKSIQNPYIRNLLDFYQIQSDVHTAKSGSRAMRSLWNRVVGDLNRLPEGHTRASTSTQRDPDIRYAHKADDSEAGTYDLDPDFENILNVFEKILGFGLTPFDSFEDLQETALPSQDAQDEESGYEASWVSPQGNWLKAQFHKLLTFLNPHHTYHIVCDEYADEERLYGELTISVNNAFKFTLETDKDHAEVSGLDLLGVQEQEKGQIYRQKLQSLLEDPNLVPFGGVESSLIAFSNTNDAQLSQKESLFASLMGHAFEDNSNTISFVGRLLTGDLLHYSDDVMVTLDHTLAGLLKAFTWDDRASVSQISPSLLQLAAKTTRLPLAFASVEALSGKPVSDEDVYSQVDVSVFKGAKTLQLENYPINSLVFTQDMHVLNKLTISPHTQEMMGLEHLVTLPSLQIPHGSHLKVLRANGPSLHEQYWMPLPDSLEVFEGVHHLHLQGLNLSYSSIENFVVEGDNETLQALTFDPAKTKTSGLGHFKNLKTLELAFPAGLMGGDVVSFDDRIPAVEKLILGEAYLNDTPVLLRGMEAHLPHLNALVFESQFLGNKGLIQLLNMDQISTVYVRGNDVDLSHIPGHIRNVFIDGFDVNLRGHKSEWTLLEYPAYGILSPEERDQPGRRLYLEMAGHWDEG